MGKYANEVMSRMKKKTLPCAMSAMCNLRYTKKSQHELIRGFADNFLLIFRSHFGSSNYLQDFFATRALVRFFWPQRLCPPWFSDIIPSLPDLE
jgi:hypothetical protein